MIDRDLIESMHSGKEEADDFKILTGRKIADWLALPEKRFLLLDQSHRVLF